MINTINKMMHILGRKEEEYKVEIGVDYSEHPVPFSWEEPNQSFQCKGSYQNILADQGCKEEDDVHIRMFSLSLQGKTKSWFKDLPAASIINFHQFTQVFQDRWVIIGNEFLIIEEYKN